MQPIYTFFPILPSIKAGRRNKTTGHENAANLNLLLQTLNVNTSQKE